MVIRGIIENSLNGQLCIRGFAPIKELARISQADYRYQRDLIGDRHDIIDFLEKQTYLFFPEIILGYKFKHNFLAQKIEPLEVMQEGKKYTSSVDNVSISIKEVSFRSNDVTQKNIIRLIELSLPEASIADKPFQRIDGNHRLTAAEKSNDDKVNRMIAPFCIIVGTEYYQGAARQSNPATVEFDKSVKVFFHNINTKTIPLTSEENLKVLIDDRDSFPDAELENIFGARYPLMTRALIKKASVELLVGIRPIIETCYRSFYNEIFRIAIERNLISDELESVNRVWEALTAVSVEYTNNEKLRSNHSLGLLAALLYCYIKSKDLFEHFKSWILQNHIFEIEEVKTSSLINIFEKIIGQDIKVFVAMPYFGTDIVKEYNKIYREQIDKIKRETGRNISLYKIMTQEGATSDQIQDIINKIQNCSICFADVTNNNANVSYEMGWARALNKKVIVVLKKGTERPKSDYQNDTYHEYDDSCRSISLGDIIYKNIIKVLKDNYSLENYDNHE